MTGWFAKCTPVHFGEATQGNQQAVTAEELDKCREENKPHTAANREKYQQKLEEVLHAEGVDEVNYVLTKEASESKSKFDCFVKLL